MSICIYSIGYPNQLPPETFHSLLSLLPTDAAAKVRRYHHWQDAYGSLFGKLLLMTALAEYGWPPSLAGLHYSEYGRPFLPNGPDFNISHSGRRAACIIARHGKVGIDLEEIKDISIGDFKEQFSPEEWTAIVTSAAPLETFYHYWTAKECLSKADGRGLNLPLAQLLIDHHGIIPLDNRHWHLHTLHSFPGFACHAATGEPSEAFVPKILTVKELELFLKKP